MSHQKRPDMVTVGGRPVPSELAEPPADLQEPGQAWWREVVPHLVDAGLLDRVDVGLLTMAAAQWQRAFYARRVLAQEGMFATGSQGQVVAHPAVRMERDATREFSRLCEQLSIGPWGRARMGLATLHGAALMRDLDAMLDGDDGQVIDGSEVPMTGAAVGLPGAV